MLRVVLGLVMASGVAGCTATSSSSDGASAPAAVMSERAQLVGTWTGSLESGAAIRVRIPERGNPSYSFDGQSVPVSAARMSGASLVLSVGSGGGTVTLRPQGDGLGYTYRFGGDRASTTLSRA